MICEEVKLGSICDRIGDGIHGTPDYDDNGPYYFFNGSNIVEGSLVADGNTKRVSESEYLKHKRNLGPNTLLISINGTIGNIAYYKGEKCILGKSAAYINLKPHVDRDFIYYALKSSRFQEYIKNANGSTIKNVSLDMLREYSFNLPAIDVQHKIGYVLSTLDDKIHILSQINDNLAKQVEIIFDEWKTKGIDNGTWQEGSIYNLFEITYGAPFSSELFKDSQPGIPLIRIRDLTTQKPQVYTEEIHPKATLIIPGDVVIGMDAEFRPYLWVGEDAWLNQRVCRAKSKNPQICDYFAILFLKKELSLIESYKIGTTVSHIGKKEFDEMSIEIPKESDLVTISSIINPLVAKMVIIGKEVRLLEQLRDFLLPKLMSGEIDVSNLDLPTK